MLRLVAPTRENWLDEALASVDTILLDHAHCEKKAASTAMGLIFRYQHRSELMAPLSELAREELRHFELMLEVLAKRGIPFQRQRPSTYAVRLCAVIREKEPHRFLDTMICCALIEARSCERMQLLAEGLTEPDLSKLYSGLLASEARHHQAYLDLAVAEVGEAELAERLAVIAAHEASVLADPDEAIRLHS
jgi:tRNA-(ms[2]io[6]A)-hydroxylase